MLIKEGIATLEELENYWSMEDVLKAAALLEMKADYENAGMGYSDYKHEKEMQKLKRNKH